MDDMKRAIYMEILKELKKPYEDTFICNELKFALLDLYEVASDDSNISEFFPEFDILFDGYAYGIKSRWEINKNEPWFSHRNRQARITLINFLLSNR